MRGAAVPRAPAAKAVSAGALPLALTLPQGLLDKEALVVPQALPRCALTLGVALPQAIGARGRRASPRRGAGA